MYTFPPKTTIDEINKTTRSIVVARPAGERYFWKVDINRITKGRKNVEPAATGYIRNKANSCLARGCVL